jgi:hypothetical protein
MEHLNHLNEYISNEIYISRKEKVELDDNNEKRNHFMYFFVIVFIILFICKFLQII